MRAALVLALALVAPALAQNAPAVGDAAPDFTARTLDGGTIRLADLRGRHVLLEFWATWCAPCVASAPRLAALYDEHPRDRFEIVGVALDSPPAVRAFVAEHGHGWPQVVEPNRAGRPVTDLYGVRGYPTSVLVGPGGTVVYRGEGVGSLEAVLVEALSDRADTEGL